MNDPIVTHEAGPHTLTGGRTLYLAKFLTSAKPDESVVYVNGDPLDNRRANLRVVKTADLLAGKVGPIDRPAAGANGAPQ